MNFYVIYERYSEYNQFEGVWDYCFETFKSIEAAKEFIKDNKQDSNYRNFIGPLTDC